MATIRHVWRRKPKNIIQAPDPRLLRRCVEVREIDDEVKKIAEDLIFTLKKVSYGLGIAIAANQIGYNKRIVAFRLPRRRYVCMINPEITRATRKRVAVERCLSLKGIHKTRRYRRINVSYIDLSGNKQEIYLQGLPAVIMQQEIDHLNGVLLNT